MSLVLSKGQRFDLTLNLTWCPTSGKCYHLTCAPVLSNVSRLPKIICSTVNSSLRFRMGETLEKKKKSCVILWKSLSMNWAECHHLFLHLYFFPPCYWQYEMRSLVALYNRFVALMNIFVSTKQLHMALWAMVLSVLRELVMSCYFVYGNSQICPHNRQEVERPPSSNGLGGSWIFVI